MVYNIVRGYAHKRKFLCAQPRIFVRKNVGVCAHGGARFSARGENVNKTECLAAEEYGCPFAEMVGAAGRLLLRKSLSPKAASGFRGEAFGGMSVGPEVRYAARCSRDGGYIRQVSPR